MEILGTGSVRPDCPNAANPFHACSARCFESLSSDHVPIKEKKLFSFGKKTQIKNTPTSSPARVIAANRSPLPSYYHSKKNVESDDSHAYSSSKDCIVVIDNFSGQHSTAAVNDSLPVSPSLAVYAEHDLITSRQFDLRRGEQRSRVGTDADRSPRTPATRPRTPEHRPRMPTTPETRPRTPKHHPRSRTPEAWPRTPDTRPRTAELRARSPAYRARSPGLRSRTPEPRDRYLEPRSRTPEPGTRNSSSQPTFLDLGDDKSRNLSTVRNKAESAYAKDDEESVLLFPELILSAQERPITPGRRGNETPSKQEEFNQLAESESSEDDDFSFKEDDRSGFLYPETVSSSDSKPKSGSSTPVHHKLGTSLGEQEENVNHTEPPELPDESQSFTLSETTRMRGLGLKHYETQSMISESYVSVGTYNVRASLSSTLQHILDKHGDIASDSKVQCMSMRSYYMEMLAAMVLELQETSLRVLKEERVAEMLAMIKDIESVKIRAGWLRSLVEEILEAAKHFDRHEATLAEKEEWGRDLLLAEQEMEERVKELARKEKETKECRESVTKMGGTLGSLEMKRLRLEKSLAFLSSKVDKFNGRYVMEGIL